MKTLRTFLALLLAGLLFATAPTRDEGEYPPAPHDERAERDAILRRKQAIVDAIDRELERRSAPRVPDERDSDLRERKKLGPTPRELRVERELEQLELELKNAPDEAAREAINRRRLENEVYIPR